MNFLLSVGKGILIGIGAVVPGISSGVLCVIFGIYEKLIDSVLGIFKDFKKNILFFASYSFRYYNRFSFIWKYIKLCFYKF